MRSDEELDDIWDLINENYEQNIELNFDIFLHECGIQLTEEEAERLDSKIDRYMKVMHLMHRAGAFSSEWDNLFSIPPERRPVSRYKEGMEPIPDYHLMQFLGQGGFGEVWKALGPQEREVALKILYSSKHDELERKSLENLRAVHHPNIISIFDVIIQDEIVHIAMQLAGSTLDQEWRSCRKQGEKGIPLDRLLRYFTDVARAIDYLNIPDSPDRPKIQHGDIKPTNIFVTGETVQIGDFSLAKSFVNSSTTHCGVMSVAFAAPEFLNGRLSSHSDQYSLAISWCFLRTGNFPFEGVYAQIITGHLHSIPDLSAFPPSEKEVLLRALAKSPHDRWLSCTEFVQALVQNCSEQYL